MPSQQRPLLADSCGSRFPSHESLLDSRLPLIRRHPGAPATYEAGVQRWTPSPGQLINGAKWNLLRYIPVKMRGAEDDKEEAAQSFARV